MKKIEAHYGRRKVPIDLKDLCVAFEHCTVESRDYLDLKTSKIITVSDADRFIDSEERESLDKIEDLGERYIPIPYVSSEEGYEDMQDFVETIKDTTLKEKLYIAIDGSGAFRRFKDVLIDYPEERKRWFEFKDARMMERVKEWLEDEGLETEGKNS